MLGLPSSTTDPNGNVTTFLRPQTLTWEKTCDPAGNCALVNLDGAGKTTDVTDRRGVKTVFSYDPLQRLTNANINSTGLSGYGQRTIALSYDGLDRPAQLADSGMLANTINYQYDGIGNVMSENVAAGQNTTISYCYDGDSRGTSAAATGANPQSYAYTYDNDSELTGVGNGPVAVTLNYDNDGRRASLLAGAVATSYVYDKDSQLLSLNYSAGGNSLGNLAYAYDADGRVINESGSLAALNLPQSEGPNTYSSLNQIAIWNGSAAAFADNNGNLTKDPVTGANYTWDSRNQLASILGGPAGSFSADYDAITRRYDQTTAYGGTTTYLHDKKSVAQSSNTADPAYTYLTLPGTGEVLAVSIASGGTTSVYVPVKDLLGSTLALVNSANSIAAQYTYDPLGEPVMSGQNLNYPYQYAGMEYDPTGLYFDGRGYYQPLLGRLLEGYGAPNAPGGGQGGVSLPSESNGGGLVTEVANQAVEVSIAGAAGVAASGVAAAVIAAQFGAGEYAAGPYGLAVAAIAVAVEEILNAFGVDIFGGGASRPTPLPMQTRFGHYPPGPFIGVPYAIIPNMQDSVKLEAPKLPSAFAGYVAAAGLAGEEVAEIGEALVVGSFCEAAAGAALAVGIYEVAEHIYAHEKTTHAKSTDHYRCRLVAEVKEDNGVTTCAYVCKGWGALATFPLPGGMASCPEGFNGYFPGP